MKIWNAKFLLLAFSLSLAMGISLFFLKGAPRAFPLDDAYIHLCYAKNLASGAGFAFNRGEPSFGTSSPLWVLLLALFIRFLEPHLLVRMLCIICLWSNFYLSSAIIWEIVSEKAISPSAKFLLAFFPSLFLAFSGNFLWIVFSGMESALFSALALDAIFVLVRKKPGIFGYFLLGLLCLTRLEAVLLLPLIFAWQWFYVKEKKKMLGILVSILIPLAFHSWAYFQLGSFFPTTRAGKLASDLFNSGISLKGGWVFLVRHFRYLWLTQPEMVFAMSLALFGLVALRNWKDEEVGMGSVELLGIFMLLIFLYHAQFFRSTQLLTPYHNFRYQVLFFPALALGLSRIFAEFLVRWTKIWQKLVILTIWFGLLISFLVQLKDWHQLYLAQARHISEVHQRTALWVKESLPESSRIACFDIGSLGFYSGRYIIDLGGLTDPKIYPYFKTKTVGAYLQEKRATHYIEMGTPGSERMLGVRRDLGNLYQLKPIAYFAGERIREPVLLHSWEMKVFEIEWLK